MSKVRKVATVMQVSDTYMAHTSGFERKGHYEPVEPTDEEVKAHARAAEAIRELNENPYIQISGYDYDIELRPLETRRWVPDETDEEFTARWVAAGRPRPLDDTLNAAIHDGLRRAFGHT